MEGLQKNMDIKTQGMRLKELRKKYKITQQELIRGRGARSNLSMIETGQNTLTESFAEVVVENFNEILKKREIETSLTLKDLRVTEEEQIEVYTQKFLKDLRTKEFPKVVLKIEKNISRFNSEQRIKLFTEIADIYLKKDNLIFALNNYFRVMNDLCILEKNEELGDIVLKILRLLIKKERFYFIGTLEPIIKLRSEFFVEETRKKIYFNMAFIFDNLREYSKTLEYLEVCSKLNLNKNEKFDVKNLQALSMIDLGQYSKAKEIYIELEKNIISNFEKLMILDNLLYLAVKKEIGIKKEYLRVSKYLKKVKVNTENYYIVEQIQYSLGKTASILGDEKGAIHHLLELLKNKTNKNVKLKLKAIQILLKIYSEDSLVFSNNLQILQTLEEKYLEFLKYEKSVDLGYDFIKIYTQRNLLDSKERFIKKVNNFY